jgi:hypothetical protein
MYKQTLTSKNEISETIVQRIADGAYITIGADNTDYQAFLLWKAEGNEPLPADEVTE